MAIPDYQSVMLPLLKVAADGEEHHIRAAINQLASQFGLTEEERKELLPSGVDGVFDNRVGWARTYLKKAGLIEYPKRGYFRITERGKSVLKAHPAKIDVRYLRQYPEFVEFQAPKKAVAGTVTEEETSENGTETPEELLSSGYLKLRKQVEAELLARAKTSPPEFFERLVVKVLTTIDPALTYWATIVSPCGLMEDWRPDSPSGGRFATGSLQHFQRWCRPSLLRG